MDPLPDLVQGSTSTSALDPGQVSSSEDGSLNPAGLLPLTELPSEDPGAGLNLALYNHAELPRYALSGSDQAPRAEFNAVDPQFPVPLPLLGEALGLMQSLAITEALPPKCT